MHDYIVSAFYGIVIAMYFNDHDPPHFHAICGDYEAQVRIDSLRIHAGWLPRRARRLIWRWGMMHRFELLANWEKAKKGKPLDTIEPLP